MQKVFGACRKARSYSSLRRQSLILLYVIGLLTLKPKEGSQAGKYFTIHWN